MGYFRGGDLWSVTFVFRYQNDHLGLLISNSVFATLAFVCKTL